MNSNGMTVKDWIQYGTAIAMILSGIVLTFLCYFQYGEIKEGVLWYMGQALTYAGAIFGVSIYFKNKLGAFESRTKQELAEMMREVRDEKT